MQTCLTENNVKLLRSWSHWHFPPNFQADIQPEKGLNMGSLPLNPNSPLSVSQLAQKLGTSIVIQFKSQIQQFEEFTVSDSPPRFAIEGAKAYVVNAWHHHDYWRCLASWRREYSRGHHLQQRNRPNGHLSFVANSKALTYQKNIRSPLGTSEQKTLFHLRKIPFQYVWVGYANQSIIARQDILKITVKDEKTTHSGRIRTFNR